IPMALIYRSLPASLSSDEHKAPAPLTRSKGRVYTLAALFCVDSLAGGLVVQSMLALWLFQRHDLSPVQAGAIFFWTGVLSALSYPVAGRNATRLRLRETTV